MAGFLLKKISLPAQHSKLCDTAVSVERCGKQCRLTVCNVPLIEKLANVVTVQAVIVSVRMPDTAMSGIHLNERDTI